MRRRAWERFSIRQDRRLNVPDCGHGKAAEMRFKSKMEDWSQKIKQNYVICWKISFCEIPNNFFEWKASSRGLSHVSILFCRSRRGGVTSKGCLKVASSLASASYKYRHQNQVNSGWKARWVWIQIWEEESLIVFSLRKFTPRAEYSKLRQDWVKKVVGELEEGMIV